MPDKIFSLIAQEEERQRNKLGLIPSENHVSPDVASVLSSCLNSKYSEGYAGRRYYEGSQFVDQIELEAIDRIKKLFGVPYVNVQPYSGSPANSAIYFAVLNPGDTLMGLRLAMGGHLTHGHPEVTFSGKFFRSIQYGVNAEARIDYDAMRKLALAERPKIIIAGNTAYPFQLDFARFRSIADEVGALLLADISHVTGLVVAGEHPSPVPYADIVMSTTHKTFRGPRGAMIMVTDRGLKTDPKLGAKIDSAIIPGMQGGPHNATTAAIALAAAEAARPAFKRYARQVRKNATALATELIKSGCTLVGGGTETHLMVVDLTSHGPGLGSQVAWAMDVAGMYANRNTVPNEPGSPFYPSGIRLGTPLITTRGLEEKHMALIADWIRQVIEIAVTPKLPAESKLRAAHVKEVKLQLARNRKLKKIAQEVAEFAGKFPLFQWK